jgi:Transmembrane secretion effector
MTAAVIMISQGAMALGGLIWGSTATMAGPSCALLGAAMLFLTSLLLSRRLSISVTTNFQAKVSGFLSGRVEPEEVLPTTLTTELLAA